MWYREHGAGLMLQVKVTTRARQNRIVGVTGDFLKVAITAVPEKGKANDVLIHFLGKEFGVPPSTIIVAKGVTQPTKILFVPLSAERLARALKQYNIGV